MRTTTILSLLILLSSASYAQESITLLPTIGYRFGEPNRAPFYADLFDNEYDWLASQKGTALNHTFSIGFGLKFSRLFSDDVGFMPRLSFAHSIGQFQSNHYRRDFRGRGIISDTAVIPTLQNGSDIVESQIQLELLALLQPNDKTDVMFGPWFGYKMAYNMRQFEQIISPSNIRYLNSDGIPMENNRTRVIYFDGDIPNSNFRFGVHLGVSHRFDLGPLQLHPEIYGRLDIGAINNSEFPRSPFEAGINIGMSFGSSSDSLSHLRLEESRKSSIKLFNADPFIVDNTQALIHTERTVHKAFIPFVPRMPASAVSHKDTERRGIHSTKHPVRFDQEILSNPTPSSVASQLLNILGSRMSEQDETTLSIRGDGAKRVREFLSNTWAIEPERISFNHSKGDILFSSPSTILFAPFIAQWVTEQHYVPHLEIQRDIPIESTSSTSTITISHQGEILARLNGMDDDSLASLSLSSLPTKSPTTLVAEMVLTDSHSLSDTVYSSIQLIRNESDIKRTEERTYYFLNPEHSVVVSHSNEAQLRHLLSETNRNTAIRIESNAHSEKDSMWSTAFSETIVTALGEKGLSRVEIHALESDLSFRDSAESGISREYIRVVMTSSAEGESTMSDLHAR